MAVSHDGGAEHRVEVLGLGSRRRATLATGAVRAVDLVGGMDLGAVESDEDAPVEAQEGGEAAALAQQREQGGEEGLEGGAADAVEQVADAVVAGDGAHAEQGAAVGVAAAVLHLALEAQEGRALEEEGGEYAEGGIGDGEEGVGAGAGIGELVGDKPERVDQRLQDGGGGTAGERDFRNILHA